VEHTVTHHRLKIVVRIDSNMERACIEVRGTLTPANIRALYVIARRARTLLPGKEIVLDLTLARAAMETITALHDPAQITELSGEGTCEKPCRLSILDPRPGARAHDHKHPDHRHDEHGRADHGHGRQLPADSNRADSKPADNKRGESTHADATPAGQTRRRVRDKEPA
jgi:hypothetical protein